MIYLHKNLNGTIIKNLNVWVDCEEVVEGEAGSEAAGRAGSKRTARRGVL